MENNLELLTSKAIDLITGIARESTYDRKFVCFWVTIGLYLFVAVIASVGNGLVLSITFRKINVGPFRYLDSVIKSLAWVDMLHGLIGMPCSTLSLYYEGTHNKYCKKYHQYLMCLKWGHRRIIVIYF